MLIMSAFERRLAPVVVLVLGFVGCEPSCARHGAPSTRAHDPTQGLPASGAPSASAPSAVPANGAPGSSTVTIANGTGYATTVYVAFGADSVVLPPAWSFCTAQGKLNCSFLLAPRGTQALPLARQYLNATFSFDAPVACGITKAEVNVNNPSWYDILDVSLVDGFSNLITIEAGDATLGPPNGPKGNEQVFGLFPLGCDVCVARQSPPCGIPKGTDGCKAGTQYDPKPPCQWQGTVMGGGTAVVVKLVPGVPAR